MKSFEDVLHANKDWSVNETYSCLRKEDSMKAARTSPNTHAKLNDDESSGYEQTRFTCLPLNQKDSKISRFSTVMKSCLSNQLNVLRKIKCTISSAKKSTTSNIDETRSFNSHVIEKLFELLNPVVLHELNRLVNSPNIDAARQVLSYLLLDQNNEALKRDSNMKLRNSLDVDVHRQPCLTEDQNDLEQSTMDFVAKTKLLLNSFVNENNNSSRLNNSYDEHDYYDSECLNNIEKTCNLSEIKNRSSHAFKSYRKPSGLCESFGATLNPNRWTQHSARSETNGSDRKTNSKLWFNQSNNTRDAIAELSNCRSIVESTRRTEHKYKDPFVINDRVSINSKTKTNYRDQTSTQAEQNWFQPIDKTNILFDHPIYSSSKDGFCGSKLEKGLKRLTNRVLDESSRISDQSTAPNASKTDEIFVESKKIKLKKPGRCRRLKDGKVENVRCLSSNHYVHTTKLSEMENRRHESELAYLEVSGQRMSSGVDEVKLLNNYSGCKDRLDKGPNPLNTTRSKITQPPYIDELKKHFLLKFQKDESTDHRVEDEKRPDSPTDQKTDNDADFQNVSFYASEIIDKTSNPYENECNADTASRLPAVEELTDIELSNEKFILQKLFTSVEKDGESPTMLWYSYACLKRRLAIINAMQQGIECKICGAHLFIV
jgi:hypothetical protein